MPKTKLDIQRIAVRLPAQAGPAGQAIAVALAAELPGRMTRLLQAARPSGQSLETLRLTVSADLATDPARLADALAAALAARLRTDGGDST